MAERKQLQGPCHTCGGTEFGTKGNIPVGDHQPVTALAKPGENQFLHTQCIFCSNSQGGIVGGIVRRAKNLANGVKEFGVGIAAGTALLLDSPDARAKFGQAALGFGFEFLDPIGVGATGGCSGGVCSDSITPFSRFNNSNASGGFVLYLSKPNTNQMQRVNSK